MFKKLLCLFLMSVAICGCRSTAISKREMLEKATLEELDEFIGSDTNNPFAYYRRAKLRFDVEQYDGAIADCNVCIEQKPDVADGYWLRGWINKELKKYDEALPDYDKAIELELKEQRLFIQRGEIYAQKENAALALADFNRAIELDPDNYYPRLMRGIIYYGDSDLMDVGAAEANYSKAIKLNPNSYYTHSLRGGLYYWLQKDDLALADFNRAIELKPDKTEYYLARAALFYRQGEFEAAMKDYSEVLALDSENLAALKRMGDILTLQGRLDEAVKSYRKLFPVYFSAKDPFDVLNVPSTNVKVPQAAKEKVLAVFPESEEIYFAWAKQAHAARDYDEALNLANQMVGLAPEDFDFLLYRGGMHIVLGHHDEAMADIDRAMQINPVYAPAYMIRGMVHNIQRTSDLAVIDYNKSIELGGDVALFYNLRADAYAALKNYAAALGDHSRAIELSNGVMKYRQDQSLLYEEMEEYELALEFYSGLIAADPEGLATYCGRAAFFKRIGRYDEALQDLTTAIEKATVAETLSKGVITAHSERCDLYEEMGKFDLALQDATTAIELTGEQDDYYFWRRALVYTEMKQHSLAIEDCDRALEIEPNDGTILYSRAKQHSEAGNLGKALKDVNRLINEQMMRKGHHDLAVVLRGEIYCMLQQYDMAIKDFNFVLEAESSVEGAKERSQQLLDWIQDVRSTSSDVKAP